MMDQTIKQTETHDTRLTNNTGKRIVGVVFGLIEIILLLRLIFKLLGANAANGFVKALYNITDFFVGIFEGIFSDVSINTTSGAVFEPATLIAIVIVAIIAWLVLKLMTPRTGSRVQKTEYTEAVDQNKTNKTDNNQQNRM